MPRRSNTPNEYQIELDNGEKAVFSSPSGEVSMQDGELAATSVTTQKNATSLYRSADTTIGTTFTDIPMDAVSFDYLGGASSFPFTAPDAGLYRVAGQFRVQTPPDQELFGAALLAGGQTVVLTSNQQSGTGGLTISVERLVELLPGDTVSLQAKASTGTQTVVSGSQNTFLDIYRLG